VMKLSDASIDLEPRYIGVWKRETLAPNVAQTALS
jgi:hypothetical protein